MQRRIDVEHIASTAGPAKGGRARQGSVEIHGAWICGHDAKGTVRYTTASDLLADLAGQESSAALARRLRRYCQPRLLCIDEVGYLLGQLFASQERP